jgi:hypothetical protein
MQLSVYQIFNSPERYKQARRVFTVCLQYNRFTLVESNYFLTGICMRLSLYNV